MFTIIFGIATQLDGKTRRERISQRIRLTFATVCIDTMIFYPLLKSIL
jgi:hypothetical protein